MEAKPPHRISGPRLLAGLFFACALTVPVWLPDDVDLWWLVAAGRWMVENGAFPRTDPFSFTALGAPWALHEWLFALFSYGIERAAGDAGLVAAELAIVALVFTSIFAAHRVLGTSLLSTVFFAFAALMSMRTRITFRPELVSLLFFAWTLVALEMRDRGRRSASFVLPPLLALWANIHSGCLYGLVAIFLWAAGALIDRDTRAAARLLGLLALCALATFLNPLGPAALAYPLDLLFDPFMRGLRIEEMQPTPFSLNYLDFWGLAALAAGVLATVFRRVRAREALVLGLTGYLAFAHVRSIGLFAVACAWFLPRLAGRLAADFARGSAPSLGRLVSPILAVAMTAVVAATLNDRFLAGEERLDTLFPIGAARFVEEVDPPGPMYNSQVWGGWLIWRFYGKRPVYFDGRNDVFAHAFDGTRGFADPANLGRFGIRLGIVPVRGAEAVGLFSDRAHWGLVYWDDTATVFVRRSEAAGPLLDRYEYRVVRPYLGLAGIAALDEETRRLAASELERKAREEGACRLARRLLEAANLGAGRPPEGTGGR